MSPTPDLFAAGGRCRPCRIVHHLGGDPGRRRGAAVGVPARRRAGRRRRAAPRRRQQMRPLVEDLTSRRARSAISRCHAARRPGAARMGRHAQGGGVGGGVADASHSAARSYAWGPLSALGLAVAVATGSPIRRSKLWLLYVFDLADRARVAAHAFLRSCAHLEHRHQLRPVSAAGPLGAMGAARVQGAGGGLSLALARAAPSRLTALALGLIIGGAVGNAIDRLALGRGHGFRAFPRVSGDLAVSLVRL